ncbi:MAG: S9 family peptidase [Planctomycetes bacterium]|nr:S9 family peptidase [Planctomycetota bacterium]
MNRLTCLVALVASAPSAWPQSKVPFSAERSWEIQRIGAPTIAPDGSFVISAVTRYDVPADKALADLWLFPTDGSEPRRLTTHSASESSPVISPDGAHVAFVAQRDDDKAAQIYVLPLAGGEARRVTNVPTGVAQPKWFPDGTRIAFLSRVWPDLATFEEQGKRLKEREDAKSKAQIWDAAPVTAWDVFVDDRELHLWSVAVAGGEPEAITRGTGLQLSRRAVPLEGPLYDIAPDGREVAFAADTDPAVNTTNMDVHVLAIGSQSARNLTPANKASDGSATYSPDGQWLAYTRQSIVGFYGDTRKLVLVERASGTERAVAAEWDRSADNLVWAPDSKRLYGAIDDAGTVRAYEIPLEGKPRPITRESSFGGLAVAERAPSVLVALRQSFVEPPTLVKLDPTSGAATKLSKVNDELLAQTDLGTFESVTYAGANGAPIQMWVNYPPGFDKTKKYPLFLLIHGGPHNGITNGMQFRWNAQVFGSWGCVTGWPNFHGSSGFGQAFTDSINPQQDALPYEDVIRAAQWFAEQPWIDSERLAAGGGSYGGYLTSILLGRPHPFRALVAHAAVYNWFTQMGADYSSEVRRFGPFWDPAQRKVFEQGSPHFGAANFATPTLVLHGQKDYRVPVNHGLELYHALLQKGVPTRFVYFPDENHWILKAQNSLVWYREVKRWLDEHALAPKDASAGAAGG